MKKIRAKNTTQVSQPVRSILDKNQEALILVLNPNAEGEFNIDCFMKLGDDSHLAEYLSQILQQLLKTNRGETSSSIQTTTATSS